jgi:quercetin dioxygenase-like cupin family protein
VAGLNNVGSLEALQVWAGVVGRVVDGEGVSFAFVELEPNAHVPEHRHANEQLGFVITGTLRFRIGGETRELGPGGTWSIPGDVPHEVHAGPEGAVAVDIFAPPRKDWDDLPPAGDAPAAWP